MYNFIIGILIGAGAILPGISSGVFCVIFGIYEKLVNSIINFFSDFKKNFIFLLPIFLGGIIGMVIFGNVLKYFFDTFPMQTSYLIIGLIIGSIPQLIKEFKITKFKFSYLLCILLTFSLSIYLVALEMNSAQYAQNNDINNFDLILSGLYMSAGLVIPGISSTVILMLQGMYDIYLNAIASFDLSILIPMGIGVFIGGIIVLKIIQVLFLKFNKCTYFCILGFVLGSLPVIYPGFSFDIHGVFSIIILFVGILISQFLSKIKK